MPVHDRMAHGVDTTAPQHTVGGVPTARVVVAATVTVVMAVVLAVVVAVTVASYLLSREALVLTRSLPSSLNR